MPANENDQLKGALYNFENNALLHERKKSFNEKLFIAVLGIITVLLVGLIAYESYENKKLETVEYASLSDIEKQQFRAEAYAYFPEILAYNKKGKFDRLIEWMTEEKGITHPNVRDIFRVYEDDDLDTPDIYDTLLIEAETIRPLIERNAWLKQVEDVVEPEFYYLIERKF